MNRIIFGIFLLILAGSAHCMQKLDFKKVMLPVAEGFCSFDLVYKVEPGKYIMAFPTSGFICVFNRHFFAHNYDKLEHNIWYNISEGSMEAYSQNWPNGVFIGSKPGDKQELEKNIEQELKIRLGQFLKSQEYHDLQATIEKK